MAGRLIVIMKGLNSIHVENLTSRTPSQAAILIVLLNSKNSQLELSLTLIKLGFIKFWISDMFGLRLEQPRHTKQHSQPA